MPLSTGEKLGPYEVVSAIGKGGMGEVWKARDPRLGRDVAIKVSAQQFTDRFEREARAIAALNHPNVCTLYHIGPNYLVMEYIEGATLAERIKEGPIPLEEAFGIAKHTADALEAAHEKSIVHRDLKPANIKIRPDGSVKVLDFGLAKASDAQEVTPDSPTMMPGTQMGMILGTAGYMSPEQARGKEVDKRADIWAYGVVLYEMVTAKRLFEGETVSDTLAAVLKEEPDLSLAPEKTRRLLRACLEKDPKRRLRDIGDAGRLLDGEGATTAPSQSRLGKVGLRRLQS
jgi:eukaryotic-like serine/threonine-protein kinase